MVRLPVEKWLTLCDESCKCLAIAENQIKLPRALCSYCYTIWQFHADRQTVEVLASICFVPPTSQNLFDVVVHIITDIKR